jgi:hypothetical protein
MSKKLKLKFNVSFKYNETNFKEIIINSNSKIECIKKLGLNTKSAGNYDTLNKYINLYNLDISHFEKTTVGLNNYIQSIKANMNNILVKNSKYSRNALKKRLYDEGFKERKCELCGQTEDWQGKKMSLILDHINGINDDNRIENLRIVCPNCNATLETHCRGSKFNYENGKRIEHDTFHDLCDCGNIKWKVSKTCQSCKNKKMRKVERPSYDVLMFEIENSNYVQVSKKYGVSDNTIRKWVKNYKD